MPALVLAQGREQLQQPRVVALPLQQLHVQAGVEPVVARGQHEGRTSMQSAQHHRREGSTVSKLATQNAGTASPACAEASPLHAAASNALPEKELGRAAARKALQPHVVRGLARAITAPRIQRRAAREFMSHAHLSATSSGPSVQRHTWLSFVHHAPQRLLHSVLDVAAPRAASLAQQRPVQHQLQTAGRHV